jgi:hypothetical protein
MANEEQGGIPVFRFIEDIQQDLTFFCIILPIVDENPSGGKGNPDVLRNFCGL